MKKLNKLSVALGAMVGVAAPLMMSGNFVNAADVINATTENTVKVEKGSKDYLQIINVPNIDFGTVTATQIYTALDLDSGEADSNLILIRD